MNRLTLTTIAKIIVVVLAILGLIHLSTDLALHHLSNESNTTKVYSRSPTKRKWIMEANKEVAELLQKEIRVLCWIATTKVHIDKAQLVKQTWGQRCTKILLMGDDTTKDIPDVIPLSVPAGRAHLWHKTREAFRYIAQHHMNDSDWFLKADTDTYVIMENLRHLLSYQNASQPHYLGCTLKSNLPKTGFNSGGAGYVLNRLSLEKLVNEAYKTEKCHNGYVENEDEMLGYCLALVNVTAGDPTDEKKKNRFFPFEPHDHTNPRSGYNWYWTITYNPGNKSIDCCSETVISFHYVPVNVMWTMEFLIYHSKLFGVSTSLKQIVHDDI